MNQSTQAGLDARYRTMLILWFALLMNAGVFFAFSILLGPEIGVAPNALLTAVLTALGILLVVLSFPVKWKLLKRSMERQDVQLVQKALIIACVMCEASALLGLMARFLVAGRQYYQLFLIAVIGTGLHFPRREDILAATQLIADCRLPIETCQLVPSVEIKSLAGRTGIRAANWQLEIVNRN